MICRSDNLCSIYFLYYILNLLIMSTIDSTCAFCCSLTAAVSSDVAELLSTIPATTPMLSLMCPILSTSSFSLSTIPLMRPVVSSAPSALLPCSPLPRAKSSSQPQPIQRFFLISSEVWPTALWDASASFFTCSATTQKPLPASPAPRSRLDGGI